MHTAWAERLPSAYHLFCLKPDDAPRAARLTGAVQWGHTEEEWAGLIALGGAGCFGVARGDDLVATATTIAYGQERGWIGMVVTHPDHRQRGLGTGVTAAALDCLRGQGVRHILLDATAMGQPIYARLGFRPLYTVGVWSREPGPSPAPEGALRPLVESDLPRVVAMDAQCFGVERPALIRWLADGFRDLGWVEDGPEGLNGFVFVQARRPDWGHIGPWNHHTPEGAARLLRAALRALEGRVSRIDVPDLNPEAQRIVAEHGFTRLRHATRMIYDSTAAPADVFSREYAIAAFATG